MMYREYGKSGLRVSLIGFGAMRFAKPQDTEAMAEAVVEAHRRGVTYFDTAPTYTDSRSEFIVGAAVKEMKRSGRPFHLASKSGHKTREEVRRSLETSLERLGVDRIDVFHMWYIVQLDEYRRRAEAGIMDELAKAKEEGLIGHIAVSTHLRGPDVAKLLEDERFEGVTLGYNAGNFLYRQDGIRAAFARGCGIAVMNPLGGGLIPSHPEKFAFLKTSPKQDILDAALHFVMGHEEISTALVGFRDKEDVRTALDAAERFRPLPPGKIEEIKAEIEKSPEDYCTGCGYCLVCPERIPVSSFVEAWNWLKLEGKEPMRGRIRWHWGVEDALATLARCTECRKCEEACTQHIDILRRFADVREALAP